MQDSKYFIFSSRYESFCLAAAEAACCGCRVMGPAELEVTRFYQRLPLPHGRTRKAEQYFYPARVAKLLLGVFTENFAREPY
jgi:hypothetical protein